MRRQGEAHRVAGGAHLGACERCVRAPAERGGEREA